MGRSDMEEHTTYPAHPGSLQVLEAGLYSLVVDRGRWHTRRWGVPVGGAADRISWQLGNALVGNPPDSPALEITLSGPTLQAAGTLALALCGAPAHVTIAGQPLTVGTTFTLYPGQRLSIGSITRGARLYLCVAGGWIVTPYLGSYSAWQPLQAGQTLLCRQAHIGRRRLPDLLLEQLVPPESSAAVVRVLEGPQRDWFAGGSFFEYTYTVSSASNRIGLRLHGPRLPQPAQELLSEPVAPGAVQITHNGLPIVLGVDGQTIGGYPKIAHVIRADLDWLGQLRPGSSVRFLPVSITQAEQAAQQRRKWLQSWITRLLHAERPPVFV